MHYKEIAGIAVMAALPVLAPGQVQLDLPERPADAPEGSEFFEEIRELSREEREQRVLNEIARGNVPEFLRELVPVTVEGEISGETESMTIHVTPDYMAIGSDEDFFRMPMSAPLAQQVADLLDSSLPTRKIVNDIHEQADMQFSPQPFSPEDYEIDTVEVFRLSHQAIEAQRGERPLGELVSGIKKDIVVTAELPNRPPPRRVAIYGWHWPAGEPIQPLSLVHHEYYMDYSHGVRLVWNSIDVEGGKMTMREILADPVLHPLLSDEGPFDSSVYPVEEPYLLDTAGEPGGVEEGEGPERQGQARHSVH